MDPLLPAERGVIRTVCSRSPERRHACCAIAMSAFAAIFPCGAAALVDGQ
jgi:hypothetical protein